MAANFIWVLIDRGLRMGLGVAVNVVLARTLGPDNFGRFAYALTLAALFMPLSTLGGERIVVRELARGTSECSMLGTMIPLRLASGFLGWFLAVATAALTAEHGRMADAAIVAVVVGGNLFLAFDVVAWAFQARGRFQPAIIARLLAFVIGAGLRIAMALSGVGLVWIAATVLVEALLGALAQLYMWQIQGGEIKGWRVDRTLARVIVIAAAPLLASELAVWIFQKIDIVILQRSASTDAVGVYAAAQRVAQIGYFLPVVAVQIFSPTVAQAPDSPSALSLVQRTMTVLVTVAYVIALALTIAASPLIHTLYGDKYSSAATVLGVLAWSNVFVFMGCSHSLYLVNRGEQWLTLRLAWMTAAVSVILNLIFIPRMHALGAAIASVATYGLTTVFGVALYAGSRPLLRLNLRALAGPVDIVRVLMSLRRKSRSSQ
jgi:polysaccharide transporter, PST family